MTTESDPDRSVLELRHELLDLAISLAEEAGRVTLGYFGGALDPEVKGDGTPVTVADRDAEAFLRERILAAHPSHGILGEELGETNPGASVRWILDPIDGTKSFVHGVPFYGVLIGIEIHGEPDVGVAHFPALDETVAAGREIGCRWKRAGSELSPPSGHEPRASAGSDTEDDGTEAATTAREGGVRRVSTEAHASTVDRLSAAVILTTDEGHIRSSPIAKGWRALTDQVAFSRTWGDCYGHCLVATGRAEVMVDPELNPWDAAALLPIVTEAGGRFTDLDGIPTIHGGNGVSTNGVLHDEVLRILKGG